MRQRIIYLLKHNAFLQAAYCTCMGILFKVMGAFIPVDKNLILFSSFMGMGVNDSPKVIYDYIIAHEEYAGYRCVWAVENPKDYPNIESVKIDTLSYFILAMKAKFWCTNTNIERGLRFKKEQQVYLNTWHGIALKYIGNDCPGRKDYNFDTVDYLVVSGAHDERVFKSAFNAKESSYLRYGMPRNEELWNVSSGRREQLRKQLSIPENKKVILYAPTWRESEDGGKSYTIKPPIHIDEWKKNLGTEYVVLFKAHHQTTKVLGLQFDDFIVDVSNYPSVNDLMIVADLLITDYSAIAFDFSILCKPILCYTYDYEDYLLKRGTYFVMNDRYPNPICKEESELWERIINLDFEKEEQNSRRFRDDFISYGAGSTEMCVKTWLSTKQGDYSSECVVLAEQQF